MQNVARRVLDSVRRMVPGRFHTRPASPQTHPHVAWAAYDDARRRLEALGFTFMGDVEPVSVATDPRMSRPNVMRLLIGDGGTVTAGFYRMALRWTPVGILARMLGGAGNMLDLITLYPDGTIIETSNAAPASVWSDPPFLQRQYVVKSTPADVLVAHHRERVRARVASHPGVHPVRVASLLEVVAASDATERAKRAWRESIGWITRDELARLGRLSGSRLDELERAVRAAAGEPRPAADPLGQTRP
jgi:hypothetical protein